MHGQLNINSIKVIPIFDKLLSELAINDRKQESFYSLRILVRSFALSPEYPAVPNIKGLPDTHWGTERKETQNI